MEEKQKDNTQQKPLSYQALTDDEFNALMDEALKDYNDGKYISLEEFKKELQQKGII